MIEAKYYNRLEGKVRCKLCPHGCGLYDGETGKCRVRTNVGGQLMSLSYGKVSAWHVDPVEKKPLYHFLPGSSTFSLSTNGCVLSCLNCQNWTISQRGIDDKLTKNMTPEEVVSEALKAGCKSISYTYTDPIVYFEFMMDIAKLAKAQGLKNILVSSGYINTKPLLDLIPFIDAANIDLKCFDDNTYQKLSGAHLKPVLNSLELLNTSSVWLEITNLIIPGWTDECKMNMEMYGWLFNNGFKNVPLHINRFSPHYQLQNVSGTPRDTLLELRNMAEESGLKYVYIGNLGLSDYLETRCPSCQTLLIRRTGYFVEQFSLNFNCCMSCGYALEGVWS